MTEKSRGTLAEYKKTLSKYQKIMAVLVILIIAFIWAHSFMPQDLSGEESSFITDHLVKPLLKFMGIAADENTHAIVRKLAHFTEFMALGAALAMLMHTFFREVKTCFIALSVSMFTAFLDETIQIFSGRGPAIADVWIDTAGAAAGILIVTLVHLLHKLRRKAR